MARIFICESASGKVKHPLTRRCSTEQHNSSSSSSSSSISSSIGARAARKLLAIMAHARRVGIRVYITTCCSMCRVRHRAYLYTHIHARDIVDKKILHFQFLKAQTSTRCFTDTPTAFTCWTTRPSPSRESAADGAHAAQQPHECKSHRNSTIGRREEEVRLHCSRERVSSSWQSVAKLTTHCARDCVRVNVHGKCGAAIPTCVDTSRSSSLKYMGFVSQDMDMLQLFASPAGRALIGGSSSSRAAGEDRQTKQSRSSTSSLTRESALSKLVVTAGPSREPAGSLSSQGSNNSSSSLRSRFTLGSGSASAPASPRQRKSSTELYKEAVEILGLTCTLSDSCRCIDCQVKIAYLPFINFLETASNTGASGGRERGAYKVTTSSSTRARLKMNLSFPCPTVNIDRKRKRRKPGSRHLTKVTKKIDGAICAISRTMFADPKYFIRRGYQADSSIPCSMMYRELIHNFANKKRALALYLYSKSVRCSYACHRTNGELWLRQDSPAESTDCVRECEISMCIRVYLLLLLLLLSLQARTSPQSLRAYIDSSLGRHEVL
ncbi:unnamed protein product [Trichogramma brassicae]|uniref:DUF4802 domain-containing protein n=1 Tax=Trichogramma brassicae TaxID=86971 RepID=A0A6H5IPF7_9HYME|nr:unnamed protein product [Trichogramma brassicae]